MVRGGTIYIDIDQEKMLTRFMDGHSLVAYVFTLIPTSDPLPPILLTVAVPMNEKVGYTPLAWDLLSLCIIHAKWYLVFRFMINSY